MANFPLRALQKWVTFNETLEQGECAARARELQSCEQKLELSRQQLAGALANLRTRSGFSHDGAHRLNLEVRQVWAERMATAAVIAESEQVAAASRVTEQTASLKVWSRKREVLMRRESEWKAGQRHQAELRLLAEVDDRSARRKE